MHYFQLNIGDFLKATDGFSNEEIGIYIRLVNRYVSTENPIKTQWVNLAFKNETQEKALAILECAFLDVGEGWICPEIAEQLDKYAKNAEKNRENGKKGGRPKKTETQTKPNGFSVGFEKEPNGNPNETLTINQETINQEPSKKKVVKKTALVKPEGVSEDVFTEWLDFKRSVSKAKTSQRMIDAITREAELAGITTEQAMCIQMENGWQGFKADYIIKNTVTQNHNGATVSKWGAKSIEPDWSTVDYGETGKLV